MITIDQQIENAEQDLAMFRKAAPQMISQWGWTKEFADYKIKAQEAIVHTLRLMRAPDGVKQGTIPVVCHFENEADRAEFIAQISEASKK